MAPVKPEPDDSSGIAAASVPPPRSPSPSSNVEPEADTESKGYLQNLVSATSPELLEKGVQTGLEVLQILQGPLEAAATLDTTQASKWLKSITELKSRAKPTRTIVGVVGNTGAGKSSVISAVLDEERLLPTNCMRACTASPTEISFNHSDDPEKLYRAEVEFISADDWVKELEVLYTDLLDGNGEVSRECSNQDSEAGVAYAKIKAVYPKKTKEMISEANPKGLANEPPVRRVLGTVKSLQAKSAASIYRQLQTYVDSNDKNTEKMMEFWPLIKVVRIFTKASALATGACIVDLPGVQDSNAARAAVAANYMKACSGLWIVAPITRAVDDKTAKSLLGDSFKRQLQYDGTYSAVSFICSKTDDISVTEAAESLQIEDQIHDSWTRIKTLDKTNRQLKSQIADLNEEKDTGDDRMEEIEQEYDTWDALDAKLAEGKTVYAPRDATKNKQKRKRTAKPSGSRKNRQSADSDDDISDVESISDGSDKENCQPDENRQPLTEQDIEQKLTSLKAEKKALRVKKTGINQDIARLRKEIKANIAEKDRLHSEVKAVCIKGRNEYSRKAIKHDFAMGIKELDQENAAEEDESSFDPEEELRDYDAVAASLPVFCVSSRAFQKLSGRMEKDNINAAGFADTDDTEIPQLQAHARKLTEAGRAASCRRFLNELIQLLNSMTMWATNDGTRSNMTDGEKRAEEKTLRRLLGQLDLDLDKAVDETIATLKDTLAENVYEKFDMFIPRAVVSALPTATSWGAHRSEGGMLWATYKATCRRNGVFSGASGPRDFNAELIEPVSAALGGSWERAFQRRIPETLNNFSRTTKLLLETFHREATHRANDRGNNYHGVNMLNLQLQTHRQGLSEIPIQLREVVQTLQREANRSFDPAIVQAMLPAYVACAEESGPGSYARMKAAMISHVDIARRHMFRNATNAVRDMLEDMRRTMRREMEAKVQDLHAHLAQDYLSVLVGSDAGGFDKMPRAERLLRSEMVPLLAQADSYFGDDHGRDTPDTTTVQGFDSDMVDGDVRVKNEDGADDMRSAEENIPAVEEAMPVSAVDMVFSLDGVPVKMPVADYHAAAESDDDLFIKQEQPIAEEHGDEGGDDPSVEEDADVEEEDDEQGDESDDDASVENDDDDEEDAEDDSEVEMPEGGYGSSIMGSANSDSEEHY